MCHTLRNWCPSYPSLHSPPNGKGLVSANNIFHFSDSPGFGFKGWIVQGGGGWEARETGFQQLFNEGKKRVCWIPRSQSASSRSGECDRSEVTGDEDRCESLHLFATFLWSFFQRRKNFLVRQRRAGPLNASICLILNQSSQSLLSSFLCYPSPSWNSFTLSRLLTSLIRG